MTREGCTLSTSLGLLAHLIGGSPPLFAMLRDGWDVPRAFRRTAAGSNPEAIAPKHLRQVRVPICRKYLQGGQSTKCPDHDKLKAPIVSCFKIVELLRTS